MKNFGFVLAAYTIIWGLLALYLGRLTVRFSQLRKEYRHIKEYLESR
ncbi:MAG: hypothetical protein K9N46_04305 [Candidatus Marinimicrobia bacterium]|nr:hypothetical protein [Candidatus Neomarinimicrobiota bacterium]MCF7828986.1 hypothetical protein [Candidatus Neomarinimicrobiota bacterium]MCF7879946.1 hypothetical protein [Candidatus Neomarinimicrobiota bacterium]